MKIPTFISMLALMAALGCTSKEPIGPDGPIDFQGTWSGTIGDPTLIQRTNVTWTATHTHNDVTGPIVFRLNATLTATGELTGKVEGDIIVFSLNVAAGSYPSPVSQSCSLFASGESTTATATSIIADLAMNWSASCLGTVTGVANPNHRLTLAKVD